MIEFIHFIHFSKRLINEYIKKFSDFTDPKILYVPTLFCGFGTYGPFRQIPDKLYIINSEGGEVTAALCIVDAIINSKVPINTIIEGYKNCNIDLSYANKF